MHSPLFSLPSEGRRAPKNLERIMCDQQNKKKEINIHNDRPFRILCQLRLCQLLYLLGLFIIIASPGTVILLVPGQRTPPMAMGPCARKVLLEVVMTTKMMVP